jgi:hypothetical protein
MLTYCRKRLRVQPGTNNHSPRSHLLGSLIDVKKDCTCTLLFPFLESVSSEKIHDVKRNLNLRRLADQ